MIPVAGGTFNPQNQKLFVGLHIRDLPESCTDELMYNKVFQQLSIDTKHIKAFQVRRSQDQCNCIGDAFVYFGSEDYAQEAMSKIIGLKLHQKELNCSLLMPTQDLKLKNNKNIFVKSLRSDVTLKTFFEAMRTKGEVLSVYLKQNKKTHKNDGYASFKSLEQAKKVLENKVIVDGKEISAVEINGVQYQAKAIEEKASSSAFPYGTFSRNICLSFNEDLVNRSDVEYENLIRAEIEKKFNFFPTSVFVWGKKARHFNHTAQSLEGQTSVTQQCPNSTQSAEKIDEKNLTSNESTSTRCFDCYQYADSNCPVLQQARRKAFVCFEQVSEATEFVNKVFSRSNGFDQFVIDESETLSINSCVPHTKIKEDQETLKNVLSRLEKGDKSYVYLGNIKQGIDSKFLQSEIEKITQTSVISLKLVNQPKNSKRNTDSADKSKSEFQYATVHLRDAEKTNSFITSFKQNEDYRKQFDAIFGEYKYANFLKPQKVRQDEVKEKKIRDAARSSNQNRQFNQFMSLGQLGFSENRMMQQFAMNNVQMQQAGTMPRGGQFPMPFNMPLMMPQFFPQGFRQNNQFNNNYQGQRNVNFQNNQNNGGNRQPYRQNRSTSYNGKVNNNQGQNQPQGPQGQQQRRYNKSQNERGQYPINNKAENIHKKPQMAPVKQPAKIPIQPPAQIKAPLTMKDLEGKSEEEKKTILGNPLFHKINVLLTEEQKPLAPKIAGMLLDPELFTTEEILSFLENTNELKENVTQALEMIQEQTTEK